MSDGGYSLDPYKIRSQSQEQASGGFETSGNDPLASGTSRFDAESTKDVWLSSDMKSRQFRGLSSGFGGDGKTGQFTANDFYSGTLRSKARKGMWIGDKDPDQAAFFVAPDGTGRMSMANGFTATAGVSMGQGVVVFMDDAGLVWPAGADFSSITSRVVGMTSTSVTEGEDVFVQKSGILTGFSAPGTGIHYLSNADLVSQTTIGSVWAAYGNRYIAQYFAWPGGTAGRSWTRAVITLERSGSPVGDANVYLTVGDGAPDNPSPVYRAISTFSAMSVPAAPTTYTFDFITEPVKISSSESPSIVVSVPLGDASNYIGVHGSIAGGIASGEVIMSLNPFINWAVAPPPPYTNDLMIYAYGNRGAISTSPGAVSFPVGQGLPDGRFLVNM